MSKITFFGGGGGGGASSTSGANIGAGTQIWLSGIPIGDHLDKGAAGSPVDGRAVTGNIITDTYGSYGLGNETYPFASGVFSSGIAITYNQTSPQSGIQLIYAQPNYLLVRDWNNSSYADLVASEVRGNPYGVGLTGSVVRFRDTGDIHWSSTTSPTGSQDLTVSRKEAGMIQVGTTSTNALGHIKASGGIFTSGVVLASPNGSGWNITIDNNGTLNVSGPYNLG